MRKLFCLVFIVYAFAACKSAPPAVENPNVGPELQAVIPELFSPNPDVTDDVMTIALSVKHPVPIKSWNITIQPVRQGTGGGGQRQAANQERPQGETRQRRAFFEQSGTGTPPARWQWNGKSSSRAGEMVQSATDYQFVFSATDVYDNSSTFEGVIAVDVLVRRDGDSLRIIVPSIIFPADSSDLSRVSEEEQRSNRRVLRLISNSLGKYPGYRITIEGHANPLSAAGTADWTRQENTLRPLSEQRARAVGEFLVANHGIERSRFSYKGMGTTVPVADFRDEDEQWKNRRVEFILER